jgi:hypothetical protein
MKTNKTARVVAKVYLIVVTLALLVLTSYVVYIHVHKNTIKTTGLSDYSFNENFNCGTNSASVVTAQVGSFITAYQKRQYGSLMVLDTYGTTAMDFSATCHRLITRNGIVYDSEYSYADASPNSLLTIATCKLDIKTATTATANCSNAINPIHTDVSETFSLDSPIVP